MKRIILLISVLLALSGCKNKPETYPSDRLFFEKTHLSFVTPENWSRTEIPGGGYPIVFAEIHYGIQPNIQLEFFGKNIPTDEGVTSFLNNKKDMYSDFTILSETGFETASGIRGMKITAQRMNNKHTAIIHIHYVFKQHPEMYILTGTCAEPGLAANEAVFDQVMKSVEIRN